MEWLIVFVLTACIVWAYGFQYSLTKQRTNDPYSKAAIELRRSGVPEKCVKHYIKELKKWTD